MLQHGREPIMTPELHRYIAHMDDSDNQPAPERGPSLRARALIALGVVGAIASVIGGLSLLATVFGAAQVIAATFYFLTLAGLIFLTAGADQHWIVWPARLLGPLPMTALIWWFLSLFGL